MTIAAISFGLGAHVAALLLIVLQACAGARLLGWLGVRDVRSHERALFGWAAGFSLTTALLMLLTLTGGVSGGGVWVAFGVMAALAWPAVREFAADAVRVARAADRTTKVTVSLAAIALVLWAMPLFVQTLLPNSDWDSALYHLPLAERYLDGSLWGRDPYFPAFSFAGAVNLHYAALLSLGLEAAITPLNYQINVLLLVATLAIGRRIGGRSSGLWTVAVFSTTPILWQLGVDPRVDGFLCLTVLLATYALLGFVKDGKDVHLKLAAVALGAALGCKYTALPFVAAIGAVGIAYRAWGSTGSRGLSRLLVTLVLLVAVPNAGWYIANLAIHGDPVFPMLRGNYIETSEGERVYLARANTEEVPEHMQDADARRLLAALEQSPSTDAPSHLFDLWGLLSEPDLYAVKPNHGLGPLVLLSLALPLVLPRRPERRRGAILLWGLGWGGFALLGSQTNLLRYVAPVIPMLAAAAGLVIARVPLRGVRVAVGVLVVVLLAGSFRAEQQKLRLLLPEVALGAPSAWQNDRVRIGWLQRVGYNFTPPVAYAAEQINAMLADGRMPAESRIMMVGEGKGRLLDCESIPDSSWFAHRFVAELQRAGLDHTRLATRLRSQGVTHVLFNREYYNWVTTETRTARSRLAFAIAHLDRFLKGYGHLLYEGGGMKLFDIRQTAADPR
ncbi:MAG: glycosyltransferase family 39 protein [Myxococcota bacterium]|nr:glycosyltransferase family 39 protein [Myxococcota bacterium]